MGQAKRRGTFEERKAAAILRKQEEDLRKARLEKARRAAMTPEEREEEAKRKAKAVQLLASMAAIAGSTRWLSSARTVGSVRGQRSGLEKVGRGLIFTVLTPSGASSAVPASSWSMRRSRHQWSRCWRTRLESWRKKMRKLNKFDNETLCRALRLYDHFGAGIFPQGAGQHKNFQKLSKWGLLEFDGFGLDLDGTVEGEVKIFKLTEAGLEVARILNIGGSTANIERILARIGDKVWTGGRKMIKSSGAAMIMAERHRQIDELWSDKHDDGHQYGELAVLEV
jgi:hypothetical protein